MDEVLSLWTLSGPAVGVRIYIREAWESGEETLWLTPRGFIKEQGDVGVTGLVIQREICTPKILLIQALHSSSSIGNS